ncbi:hypothetical protein [Sinomicrobium sp. M5D2P9]
MKERNNVYKKGEQVCAIVRPTVPLIIRVYVRGVYYCKVQNDLKAKELVYFERELKEYIA